MADDKQGLPGGKEQLLVEEADGTYSPAFHLKSAAAAILGTQYTEGDVDTQIGGSVVMGEAPGNTIEVIQLDQYKWLKVSCGGEGYSPSETPSVTIGAYSAGDAVGGLLTFVSAARETGLGGIIKDVKIIDDAGQDAEMELWLFRAAYTPIADNAAWAPAEASLHDIVAIISTTNGAWFAAGTPSVARVECSQRYECVGTSLFGQLVTRGTPTFAAIDDISVILGLLRD